MMEVSKKCTCRCNRCKLATTPPGIISEAMANHIAKEMHWFVAPKGVDAPAIGAVLGEAFHLCKDCKSAVMIETQAPLPVIPDADFD